MNITLSLTLAVWLVAAPLAATRGAPKSGRIAAAALRESTRMASASQDRFDDSNWLRIRQLAPGTEVIVTIRGSRAERRVFSSADASHLTVADPSGRTTSLARGDVVEVRGPVRTRSWLGGLVGAAIGVAGGYAVGASIVHNSGREAYGPLFWGPLAGGVAGGLVGAHTLRYVTADVLYRAAPH